MIASYLWSKLEGNYDGNYYPDYDQMRQIVQDATAIPGPGNGAAGAAGRRAAA